MFPLSFGKLYSNKIVTLDNYKELSTLFFKYFQYSSTDEERYGIVLVNLLDDSYNGS